MMRDRLGQPSAISAVFSCGVRLSDRSVSVLRLVIMPLYFSRRRPDLELQRSAFLLASASIVSSAHRMTSGAEA